MKPEPNQKLVETYSKYGEQENLSPDSFLRLIPEEKEIAHCIDMSRVWDIEEGLQSGTLDPPWYAIHGKEIVSHDGRHRAMACLMLGIKEIPVFRFEDSIPLEAISSMR